MGRPNIGHFSKGYFKKSLGKSNGKRISKFFHIIVWEKYYGKVPSGYQIHHKDGNKLNNDISNLQLVTPLEHKRLHGGCKLENGNWIKPCTKCKVLKEVSSGFYIRKNGWINTGWCKKCCNKYSLERFKLVGHRKRSPNYKINMLRRYYEKKWGLKFESVEEAKKYNKENKIKCEKSS